MSVRLKIEHGQDAGRTWRLKEPGVYVVGRDGSCALRVLDMKVSKAHCEIHVGAGAAGMLLRDLKSTHGTQLNGQPLKGEAPLKAGDEIRVGFMVLRLLSDGTADLTAQPNGPLPAAGAAPAEAASGPSAPAAQQAAQAAPVAAAAATDGGSAAAPGRAGAAQAGPPRAAAPRKELPADELVGKTLGGYAVRKKIGQGGMGAVYVAEQVSLKREVAIKVLSEKFVADSAFVDQFLNEARAAGALNHPNVVQVYDVGQVDGRYFFSMEFVHGGSIEDHIKDGSAPWSDALSWFIDAANALVFAQKRGILHRDVKPDNLMLSEDGSAKLCDLGLAKKSESADLLSQGIIGTPHFLSPEAIRRKGDIDHRTDLYSLGCTFYRILSGENAYPAKTVKDILLGHLNKPVPRVTDKQPEVPKELSDVVYKLMQKEPGDRYATAEELWTALDKIRVQHGLAAHGISPGSKKPLVITLVAVLLAAGGAITWFATRPEPVAELTESQKQEMRDKERQAREALELQEKQARESFLIDSRAAAGALETDILKADVGRTWDNDTLWKNMLDSIQKRRDQVASDPKYGKDPEVEQQILPAFDKLKAGIERDREFNRTNAEAKKKLVDAYEQLVDGLLAKVAADVGAALTPAEGQLTPWWTAAALVGREAVQKLVADLKEKRKGSISGREFPLMESEELEKRVARALPGEDWPGSNLWKRAFLEGEQAHRGRMSALQDLLKKDTPADFAQAEADATAYLEALPEPDPSVTSGEIPLALRKHRGDVQKLLEALRSRSESVARALEVRDQHTFHVLTAWLREPGKGRINAFKFPAADDEAKRHAGALTSPAYKARGEDLLLDASAFTGLFDHLQSSFPTWTDTELEDEAGRKQKVKEVHPDGLTCPATTKRSWADLGADYLLKRVFYAKNDAPRFAFSTDDLRGLAVLSELVGDESAAVRHWKAYGNALGGDAALLERVNQRLARLDREMKAARLYGDIKRAERNLEDFRTKHGLPLDPYDKDPLKIPFRPTAEQRDAIQREHGSLEKWVSERGFALQELRESAELRDTLWGLALRAVPPAAPAVPPGPGK